MDWQQLVSLAIVGSAAGFLLWSKVRRPKFSFKRDTHCGCVAAVSPQASIVFHARKGERPQVRVRVT